MVLWALALEHNLGRVESLMSVVTEQSQRNAVVLSADTLEYRDYFQRFPTRSSDVREETVLVEFYKRPAYGPTSTLLTMALGAAGVDYPVRLYVILSLYAAGAVVLLCAACRVAGLPVVESILLAMIAAFSFGWATVFSIPESYSLSTCAAIVALISGMGRQSRADRQPPRWLGHAVISGAASWFYLPIAGAVLLIVPRLSSRRQWLTVLAPAAVVALGIAAAPHLWRGEAALQYQADYAARWSTLAHFADVDLVVDVLSAFTLFSLVTPVPDFMTASPETNLLAALRMWPTLLGVAIVATAHVAIWGRAWRAGVLSKAAGAWMWFGTLLAFHVYFNPREVLLYLAVPVAVLIGATAIALAESGASLSPAARRRRVAVLAMVATTLALVNAPAVLGP
jgi:hypothetical protein